MPEIEKVRVDPRRSNFSVEEDADLFTASAFLRVPPPRGLYGTGAAGSATHAGKLGLGDGGTPVELDAPDAVVIDECATEDSVDMGGKAKDVPLRD
jgi:hypothetical protein